MTIIARHDHERITLTLLDRISYYLCYFMVFQTGIVHV